MSGFIDGIDLSSMSFITASKDTVDQLIILQNKEINLMVLDDHTAIIDSKFLRKSCV